ncbi:substrate-binding domain-containing protein [Oceanirhabdus sp. W0125-5]|uniref:substrate-binding domain-containing protein n=1 Tax=Oceanirhabdus sp. W0125-5 TaxID=2999116 RepID=UPI0022F33137|nr:substrate-binding domain-containing protein [Oceanirhabdus sp. W0125-5]WBW99501.1 substrate-binding domain-containing protein [Oceanirhabdus sp. W0125-5]
MSKKRKIFIAGLVIMLVLSMFSGCANKNEKAQSNKEPKQKSIILATTTSTENSGLLADILPDFTEKTGIDVKVVAVGTGKALAMGRDGEADVLLVHAKASEEEFVNEGHGTERFDVMYNDFVLVGSKDDKANLKELSPNDIFRALSIIKENECKFITRGDDSGTHKKELSYWKSNDITPEGDWYISTGQGMGATLNVANESLGYTLTDRATYLSMKENLDLEIIVEGDEKLFNQYGVIPVNPDKNNKINAEGAKKFVEWILSEETQKLISEFGVDKFGQNLFNPNANK